jgi:hypothetical protein
MYRHETESEEEEKTKRCNVENKEQLTRIGQYEIEGGGGRGEGQGGRG